MSNDGYFLPFLKVEKNFITFEKTFKTEAKEKDYFLEKDD